MVAKKQDPPAHDEPRWDDIRIFLAVLRARSLGLAGKRLGLDTSTVSRRLSALEETLGARLFERTRQGLVATRTAEQLQPAAEAIEASHARLLRAASAVETLAEGTVRVSIPPGMADVFVAPALGRLRARHPRLSLELETSIRPVDMSSQEADLAVRSVGLQGAELVVTKLAQAPWLVAASAQLARELGKIEDWRAVPWIAWDYDLGNFEPSVWLARYARGASIALRTSHMGAQLRAAEAGCGVMLLPEPYLKTNALVPVRYAATLAASVSRLPDGGVWLVAHRATRDTPRIAAVWSFLVDEFRSIARGKGATLPRPRS